jgi:hypothetical protein
MYQLTDPNKGLFSLQIDKNNFEEVKIFDISLFEIDQDKNLVNLTKIANHFNKRVNDWKSLPATEKFLSSFFKKNPLPENLVMVQGGNKQGTWASKKLALKFAEWISVDFEIFANEVLDNHFTPKQLTVLDILELNTIKIKELKAELDYKNQIVIERAESVPAETIRLTLNRVIRDYAKKQEIFHPLVWGKLYEEFKYRFHIDLKARAKKGKSKIQIAEEIGELENLYNLSLEMFEVEKIVKV